MLHTSDWHLGRGFHGGSLRAEQSELLTTLCATVKEKQVDVVLVSGDIYDRALPPEWAIKELEDCLLELARDGTEVIITSGNHDSAQRLGFGRGLMAASGVHIRSALADAWVPVELTGDDGAALLVYGVPYLEPQLYAGELGVRPNHTALMTEVLAKVREDAEQRRRSSGQNPTVVVMAHVFVSKGVASESERHIGAPAVAEEALEHHEDSIGGLAVVPLDVFDGFDYVALGHLHGRQRLSDRVRYSGSPLRYSFSEEKHTKGAWLVDAAELDSPKEAVTPVDWRIGRAVKRLAGTIDQMLDPATVDRWAEAFVQITLTDQERPERAYPRLREAYPHLMQYSYAGAGAQQRRSTFSQKVQEAETEYDVVAGFLRHVRQRAPSSEETTTLEQALETVR